MEIALIPFTESSIFAVSSCSRDIAIGYDPLNGPQPGLFSTI